MNEADLSAERRLFGEVFACDDALAHVLARQARLREYAPHAVIAAGDAVFEHVHLLIAGHARMVAFGADGRLVAIEDYAPGDLFGETGLFDREPAPHDIAAVRLSRAAAFANALFLELMAKHACVALAVSRRLVARLARVTRRMVEGATLSATGRIHAELLRQARASPGLTIRPAPVLADFALLAQTTRETVSRTISALEKRGVIRRDSESLRVVAPHRLEEQIY